MHIHVALCYHCLVPYFSHQCLNICSKAMPWTYLTIVAILDFCLLVVLLLFEKWTCLQTFAGLADWANYQCYVDFKFSRFVGQKLTTPLPVGKKYPEHKFQHNFVVDKTVFYPSGFLISEFCVTGRRKTRQIFPERRNKNPKKRT